MNFKFLLLLLSISAISGCGVKAKPLTPPEMAVKSYVETYTGEINSEDQKTKETEKKK